jgi:hypothetical protein
MRKWFDHRGVDREHRVEEMCEMDTQGLGGQPEQRAVAIETPRTPLFDDIKVRLSVAVEKLARHLSGGVLVGQLNGVGAVPLNTDDSDDAIRQDAPNGCSDL